MVEHDLVIWICPDSVVIGVMMKHGVVHVHDQVLVDACSVLQVEDFDDAVYLADFPEFEQVIPVEYGV